MSIFPRDYNQASNKSKNVITKSESLPLLKEYAIDFDSGEILTDEKGKFYIVDGIEAVKVRCWLALKIQKGRYLIYPNEGNNLKSLIGKDITYVNKSIQSILNEALVDGMYVTSVNNISIEQNGDTFTTEFTINSIYGSYNKEESW
ncbi:DUF2634 domain-containing protein [Clostridium beijerinckii]|uniref:DUF2634 domain-containing protein n=1 Tax=Clostridium beijerinckii TaxID=1520 RepID=UPI00098CE04C|nr:DUF2634 domain-containing protein [Clostridium beijerinckii]MBA8935791.1 hypothetical protein [Clostridium beijerinckii]NRU40185.1 hypothetical protein [Clostridium beijerinckii]NSA96537.1 Fe-S cluster assembly iron-binding protein IscA [Clostridium beijerinckii]OOM53189.1 hypothetical protein CLOBI_50850 [Clostridium beijerinckii]OOM70354.1 hypothetical protein CLBEIC_20180 [Clostridium beijerinckii]